MNTGTPLDLTPFGSILTAVSVFYWLIAIGLFTWAVVAPKRRRTKSLLGATVFILFAWLPITSGLQQHQVRMKLHDAMARFEELCKSAGPRIYRTVENVEGIRLDKVRPNPPPGSRGDPNWVDAALPDESRGEGFIRTFLYWEQHQDKRTPRGYVNGSPSDLPGYRFVDAPGEGGVLTRYRLTSPDSPILLTQGSPPDPARYSITYDNIIDPGDRLRWIAGTKVSIIDTQSHEKLAEHTWYSIEPGQGSTAGFRAPWGFAKTCPMDRSIRGSSTRFFVDQVLKPKEGE